MSFDDIQGNSCPTVCDACNERMQEETNGIGWRLLVFTCTKCRQDLCSHLESRELPLVCVGCGAKKGTGKVDAEDLTTETEPEERHWGFMNFRTVSDGKTVYMRRITIFLTPWFSVKLHRIYRPDNQRHLHSHPWNFLSVVLWGWYKEETLNGLETCRWFNFKRLDDRHSIRWISRKPIWTLVFTGRRQRIWGFWVNDGKQFVPWYKYDQLNNP